NGKIDRSALPKTRPAARDFGLNLPQNAVEETICNIWASVLGVEQVGPLDDFFELGGHSLLATQISSRIKTVFRIELPLRTVFECRSAGAMAELVRSAIDCGGNLTLRPLVAVERQKDIPLSYSQQRLWLLDQLRPGATAFIIPLGIRLIGDLQMDVLGQSLRESVRRHESLRTTFAADKHGQVIQVINSFLDADAGRRITIPVVDLSTVPDEFRAS